MTTLVDAEGEFRDADTRSFVAHAGMPSHRRRPSARGSADRRQVGRYPNPPHEAVDNIVEYNERLVERMAATFTGREPRDPDLLDEIADRHRLRFSDK